MKKTTLLLYFVIILINFTAGFSQTTFNCGSTFTDPAGATANYENNSDYTVTIFPDNIGEKVTVTFSAFDLEATWDALYVFDGNTINSPLISSGNQAGNVPGAVAGGFWGTVIPGPFTSTSTDGSLTFRFRSDAVYNSPGWIANVSCSLPSTCLTPSNLSTTQSISNTTLNWTENGTATAWEVFIAPSGTPVPNVSSTGVSVLSNSYTLTGVTQNISYNIYVRSICGTNDFSAWSNAINFIDSTTCTAPTQIISSSLTSNSVNFSWANNPNATTYEYAVQLASISSVPTSGTIVTSNSTVLNSLLAGTSYKFYVRTLCNNLFNSTWSVSTFSTLVNCLAPTAVVSSNITVDGANFSLTNNPNAISYEYAVQLASIATPPTSGTIITSNTIVLNSLLAGTSYKFYVRTLCNNLFNSAWSNVNFTTLTVPPIPPVCGGLFIDNGNVTSNYNNNSNETTIICPSNPGDKVTVSFTSFDIESVWDGLYVYDGSSTTSNPILSSNPIGGIGSACTTPGAFWGTNIPGPFTSSSADGCLTFNFKSDASFNKTGWVANVICAPEPTCPQPTNLIKSNITTSSVTINWTSASTISQWEVIILSSSQPAPDSSAVGILTSTKPFIIDNLNIASSYTIYVRSICSITDKSLWSASGIFNTLSCVVPSASLPTLNAVTNVLNWTWSGNTIQQYEVLILPASALSPLITDIGISTTGNSYIFNSLICNTAYKLYVRTVCNSITKSNWSTAISYQSTDCILTTGSPINLQACSDSSVIMCLNLNDNDVHILNGLNANDYSINYYTSSTNAASQTNSVTTYCLINSFFTIYAVLKNNITLQTQTFSFQVSANTFRPTQIIANLDQCDDDQNGTVIYDLSTSAITTVNPIIYYLTLIDAKNQTNAITTQNIYPILTSSNSVIIFARETIINNCDNIFSFRLNAYADCNIAHNCINANSLCGSLGMPFNNTHQGIIAEPGNNYGCLNTTPNPTWFYLPISDPGSINLTIVQNTSIDFTGMQIDVDYIIYGPFTNPTSPCTNGLNQSNTVSCSYSGSGIEYPVITNALAGQYYLLMVTNFSNQAGYIKITANPTSTGTIECSGLRLNAFLDSNGNGTQDTSESNFPLGQFQYDVNNGVVHNVTSPVGRYTIYDLNATNVYNLAYNIDPIYSGMYNLNTPPFNNVTVNIGAGITTYNFPINAVTLYNDLAVNIIPLSSPRAGSDFKNRLYFSNLGSQTIASGNLEFTKDSAITITSTSQIVNNSPTGFTFIFNNLLPFESRFIDITMMVPTIPAVSINQLLSNNATIATTVTESMLTNNSSNLVQAVIAAYDPNDKIESHGKKILYSSFASNEFLNYTIRFENTGNAAAIDVKITDILDARIDETSIKMISASNNNYT